MKLDELLKAVDSGVVEEIIVSYCGGRIKIEPNNAPFELPNYPIAKIWQSENGRGLSVLLADNTTKDERGASESANADNAETAADSASWENAEKAAETLRKYCAGFNDCTKNCIFYDARFGCGANYPTDYKTADYIRGQS